jgi:hypothetical protein
MNLFGLSFENVVKGVKNNLKIKVKEKNKSKESLSDFITREKEVKTHLLSEYIQNIFEIFKVRLTSYSISSS